MRRIECEVFEKANFEAEIEDLKVADDHYAAILPLRSATPKPKQNIDLRILALRRHSDKWSAFTSFLSHCEGRRGNTAQWSFLQVFLLYSELFPLIF